MGQRVAHGTKSAASGGRLRYAGRISLQQKMNRRKQTKGRLQKKQDALKRFIKLRKISPFAA